jgi:undecaprenyl-diphosphatase
MAFLTRYVDDDHRPSVGEAGRDLLLRAVAPAVVLFGAIVGFGLLLKGPLKGLAASEESVNKSLAAGRTPTMNTITMIWSHIGNTEYVIAVAVLVALIVFWRTKEWWYAIVPVVAISIQATVFVLATLLVDRARPKVEHLDPAPPTSSYPSGHQGASTALYLTFALMAASRIRNAAVRAVVVVVCIIVPFLVAYARLYRGMHHVTDVSVGAVNGIVSALLAWLYLRRGESRKPS